MKYYFILNNIKIKLLFKVKFYFNNNIIFNFKVI